MNKLVAVMILTAVSAGAGANEFIQGFYRPDGVYVAGHTQVQRSNQMSQANDDAQGDAALKKDSLLTTQADDPTATGRVFGDSGSNSSRRDPRSLRNAEAIEQLAEQENNIHGLVPADTGYIRKKVANEYGDRRLPNSRRANEANYENLYTSSYINNSRKINSFRKLLGSNY
ncbi:MAG: hypothetical protein ABIT92_03080 [Gammaproteobacteria bacterium]